MHTTQTQKDSTYESQLDIWILQEKSALDLINLTGKLWFEKSIELVLFRNQLVDRSVSEVMNLHQYAKDIVKKPISTSDTSELARIIYDLEICPSKLDIGKLAYEWFNEKQNFKNSLEFVQKKLQNFTGHTDDISGRDVVLFGFGRIGRLAARELISQAGK
ncbi:MAG: glyceraldehyde-3-phosphate dehydrogenase, partial [Bacteroidota bacterium]